MDQRAENAQRSAPSARKREALELFAGLPRRYDLLSAALSFGQDPRWRRALVDALAPEPGDRVLDVATGTGLVARELLERCDCSVVGVDQSAAMLARARTRFGAGEGARVELLQAEAEALPFASESFDALTFTYLLRYVDDPRATVAELARVLRAGGRIASLEFGVPQRAPARAAWRLYTAAGLPLLGRVASREWGLVAFALAVGVAAHALDELHDRPLRTALSDRVLVLLAAISSAGALAIGVVGAVIVSVWLLPLVVAGALFLPAYNLELARGRFHGDRWFALGWGAFPAFTGYFANAEQIRLPGILIALGCFLLSAAQRRLSTPARELRRRTQSVSGTRMRSDGSSEALSRERLLAPLDGALAVLALAIFVTACAALAARL